MTQPASSAVRHRINPTSGVIVIARLVRAILCGAVLDHVSRKSRGMAQNWHVNEMSVQKSLLQ
jgi:hypothetical protein